MPPTDSTQPSMQPQMDLLRRVLRVVTAFTPLGELNATTSPESLEAVVQRIEEGWKTSVNFYLFHRLALTSHRQLQLMTM
jgi:hypothetical protein